MNRRPTDPFDGLPFRMTLPAAWRQGLQEFVTEEALDVVADAVFAAHEPGDVSYSATLVVFGPSPVEDADEALFLQEVEFREGAEAEPASDLDSFDIQRVTLPAGPALRVVWVRSFGAQVQYYLFTPGGRFDIWFTSPRSGLDAREIQFDAMARSFVLTESRSGQGG